MIVVIADDFTGAAELAGAAAERGYSAEVQTEFDPTCCAGVIAVDTNTRLVPAEEAARQLAVVASNILLANPTWIYKKTDSVLRGNVLAEIESLLSTTGLRRALLIPANPGKGRTIRRGVYYIDGIQLTETPFVSDPEHPRRTSNLIELLCGSADGRGRKVRSVRTAEPIPTEGIIIPDIDSADEIVRRTSEVDRVTLPSGGVEFFQKVLERKLTEGTSDVFRASRRTNSATGSQDQTTLFVCGSSQAWHHGREEQCTRFYVPVVTMPTELYQSGWTCPPEAVSNWAGEIVSAINTKGCAMAAIGRDAGEYGLAAADVSPAALTGILTKTVAEVLCRSSIDRICIEGGATAADLIARMGWSRFTACPPGDLLGVSTLRIISPDASRTKDHGGLTIVVKPGSYPWPNSIWPNRGA